MVKYNPEIYWSRVAQEIQKRGENYIAGDDNPYYRYKRRKFLNNFLDSIDFSSKTILEVGCGPGGNLKHLAEYHQPKKLLGADISAKMLEIANKNLQKYSELIELKKINGIDLPFAEQSVDISFTVTVLQHNTDEAMVKSLIGELCRVTKTTIILIEDIGNSRDLGGEGSWIGREIDTYKSTLAENGFELSDSKFLNLKASRFWYNLVYSRLFKLDKKCKEGEAIGIIPRILIGLPLPITSILDKIFTDKRDLVKMTFYRV